MEERPEEKERRRRPRGRRHADDTSVTSTNPRRRRDARGGDADGGRPRLRAEPDDTEGGDAEGGRPRRGAEEWPLMAKPGEKNTKSAENSRAHTNRPIPKRRKERPEPRRRRNLSREDAETRPRRGLQRRRRKPMTEIRGRRAEKLRGAKTEDPL